MKAAIAVLMLLVSPAMTASGVKLKAQQDKKGYLDVYILGAIEGQRAMFVTVSCDHQESSSLLEVTTDSGAQHIRLKPYTHMLADDIDQTTVKVLVGDRSGSIIGQDELKLILR